MTETAPFATVTWTCPLCGPTDDPVLHGCWHDGQICYWPEARNGFRCTNAQPCDGKPHRAAYADHTWEQSA